MTPAFLSTPFNPKHNHLDSTSNIPNPIIHYLSLVHITMVPHLNCCNYLVCMVWMLFMFLYGQFFLHSNEGCQLLHKCHRQEISTVLCMSMELKPRISTLGSNVSPRTFKQQPEMHYDLAALVQSPGST